MKSVLLCGYLHVLNAVCQGQTVSLPAFSTAVLGERFKLTCTVTGGLDPSTPRLVTFKYGSTSVCLVNSAGCSQLQPKPRFSCGAQSCGSGQTRVYFLNINPICLQDDRDDWSCQYNAKQSIGNLNVNYPPSVTASFPSTYSVIEQRRLTIDCSRYTTPGKPSATSYVWRHPGGSTTLSLDISSIRRSQSGPYTCTASNTLLPGRQGNGSATVEVTVLYGPVVASIIDPISVIESSTLLIDCSTHITPGLPSTTSYRWTGPNSFNSTSSVLSISRISKSQAGQYTCTVTNTLTPTDGLQEMGRDSGQVDVKVQYLEAPVLTLVKTEVMENGTVDISCDVVSNPTAQMSITNTDNNTVLVKDTTNSKQITISPVQCLHNGTYVCSANNPDIHTETSSSRQLNVLCSPRPDYRVKLNSIITKSLRETAVFEVEFIANPSPNYTWYRYSDGTLSLVDSYIQHKVTSTRFKTRFQINITDSRVYGDYAVVAQNVLGRSEMKFFLRETAPGSPPVSSISAGAIAGSIVGVLAVFIVVAVVLMIMLYRKGYRCKCGLTKEYSKKNGQETEEYANRVYSTIDTNENQTRNTYEGLQNTALQHYSGLAVYENTKGETTANQAIYEGLKDKSPTKFETAEMNAYENTGNKVKNVNRKILIHKSVETHSTGHMKLRKKQTVVVPVVGEKEATDMITSQHE